MKFEKGQSGNPGGRPKEVKEVQDLARAKSVDAIERLAKIMKDDGAPHAAQVAAANSILDRALGKPPQAVTGEGGEGPVLANITVTFVRPDGES